MNYYETRGELVDFSQLDTQGLKRISEACSGSKEKPAVYFGKDVTLSPEDIKNVNLLLYLTRTNLGKLEQGLENRLWEKFQEELYEQNTKGIMTWGRDYVRVGEGLTSVKSGYDEKGKFFIEVPKSVKHLYEWEAKHQQVSSVVERFSQVDQDNPDRNMLYGTNAVEFGKNIKELYRFNKELSEGKK
jgi:hypothetical protein